MTSAEETKRMTEELLANESDVESEKEDIPTQIPTPFTIEEDSSPFPLGQTQGSSLQPSLSQVEQVQTATDNQRLLSQLSTESRWEQTSTGFTQIERMMQLQSQAQQMAYPNYPPHLQGVPFGLNFPQGNTQVQAKTKKAPTAKKKAAKPKKNDIPLAAKKTRGPAFKEQEGFALLDVIERKNTIAGRVNWELVCAAMEKAGWPKRGVDATKKRYWEIINKAQKMPTGDPDVPKLLLRAREVHYLVRSNNGVGDPSEESAAIEGEIQEITEGATAVRSEQVIGKTVDGDSDSDAKPAPMKTPNQKSFVARRVSTSASKTSVFEAVSQMQAEQMAETRRIALEEKEEARRIRKEEQKERREQNKLWLKLGAMAVTAFLGNGSDEVTKNELKKDLLKAVITADSDFSSDDDSSLDLTVAKKKRRI